MKISEQEKRMELGHSLAEKEVTHYVVWLIAIVGVIQHNEYPYYLSSKCRDGRHSECRSESCECSCHYY